MANPSTEKTEPVSSRAGVSAGRGGEVSRGSERAATALSSEYGTTRIADVVVQKIAGMAARDVAGVRELGGGSARAFGAIRERIPGAGTSHGQGVAVEVGERQAAVDLEILVDYGVAIPDLARAVRRNVMTGIEGMTGLEVVEVNINVNDVYLGEDTSTESGRDRAGGGHSRVQ